ncbi:hypothetical protein C6P40_004472, partial [Pichia californica]
MIRQETIFRLYNSWDSKRTITTDTFAHHSKIIHHKERSITPALSNWSSKMNVNESIWKIKLHKLSKLHYKFITELNEIYELQ